MESGTRLGPYEILEQFGAGGMGEVAYHVAVRLGCDVEQPRALAKLAFLLAGVPALNNVAILVD